MAHIKRGGVSTIVAEEKVNISAVNVVNHDDYTITLYFTLETTGLAQLSRLLVKVEGVRGVMSVARVGAETDKAAPAAQLGLPNKN